jgi:3-oxoacyl-[acyl-carrier protein] reductase
MQIEGSKAIVTGGGRGIGRAISIALAEKGADVIVNYVSDERSAEETVSAIRKMGRKALAIRADVSKHSDCIKLFEQALLNFGSVDILVNNAGVLPKYYKIEEITEEEWNRIIGVNLTGTFFMCKLVAKHMMGRRRGKIVNISSIAGKEGGTVGVAYAASKAGVIGLTRALARELAPFNITVNAVAPGPVDTSALSDEVKRRGIELSPQGRIARPEEIAHAVIFLIENDHVNGEVININGGRYMD